MKTTPDILEAMAPPLKVTQRYSYGVLSEAMQNKNIRFAILIKRSDDHYDAVHPYTVCRDYMKDALFMRVNHSKNLGTVYGFNMAAYPDIDNISLDDTYLAVTAPKEMIDMVLSQIDHLTKLEAKYGCKQSTWERVELADGNSCLVVIGDSKWQGSLLAYSFYTFLFRAYTYPNFAMHDYGPDQRLWDNCRRLFNAPSLDAINALGFDADKIGISGGSKNPALYDLHNKHGLLYVSHLGHAYQKLFSKLPDVMPELLGTA